MYIFSIGFSVPKCQKISAPYRTTDPGIRGAPLRASLAPPQVGWIWRDPFEDVPNSWQKVRKIVVHVPQCSSLDGVISLFSVLCDPNWRWCFKQVETTMSFLFPLAKWHFLRISTLWRSFQSSFLENKHTFFFEHFLPCRTCKAALPNSEKSDLSTRVSLHC